MTPVFIIDDNHLFCEGLKHFLSGSPFEIVGEAADLGEFGGSTRRVDDGSIFLLDFPGSLHDPQSQLNDLRTRHPASRLVVLTANEDKDSFFDCVTSGVDGYLLKNISPVVLIESLRLIMLGEKVFPSMLATWLLDGRTEPRSTSNQRAAADADLSRREIDVLECLVEGDSNKAIARELSISDATVKVHVKNILRKICVANRTQAAIWALTTGVVGDGRFALRGPASGRDANPDAADGSQEAGKIGSVDGNVG